MQVFHARPLRPLSAYWSKVEPIFDAISIYGGARAFLEQFGSVQPEVGHLFATHWCQAEVSNGGFGQFFWNSTGILAPEAVVGFRVIGMPEVSALVDEAMRLLGRPYPRGRTTRLKRLDALPGTVRAFVALDERFEGLIEKEAGGFNAAADRYSTTFQGNWLH